MKDPEKPAGVTGGHLSRKAIVYLRQSTEVQVRENDGSTAYQRDQAAWPRAWGWADADIEIVDEDLGRSGSSTIHRTGIQRILAAIEAREVGAIFVSDFSRLGRNNAESAYLVDRCKVFDVLIVVDGRVHNPRDRSDRFLASLLSSVAELENDTRREALYNGRLAKAKRGIAVSPPPVGYVSQRGEWLKDPDPAVRDAVVRIFGLFLDLRTLQKTVAVMRRRGIDLPRRDGHCVYWKKPDVASLGFMMRNAAYCGDYVFRKRRVDLSLGRSPNGRPRDRVSEPEEMIVIRDHHEPYIDRATWKTIQQILDLNAPQKRRRNPGRGDAILQGIFCCGLHEGTTIALGPKYKQASDGSSRHFYACNGEVFLGGERCGSVPSRLVEEAVTAAVEERLQPPAIEQVREAWRRLQTHAEEEQRWRRSEVERARNAVRDWQRRYEAVDPANRLVAAEIEANLERAKRKLLDLEQEKTRPGVAIEFTEADFEQMLGLTRKFRELWDAPTTTAIDRKQILRAMVDRVVLEARTEEELRIRIEWTDASPATHRVVDLHPKTLRRICAMHAAGVPETEIVALLRRERVPTLRRGEEWSVKRVRGLIYRHSKTSAYARSNLG